MRVFRMDETKPGELEMWVDMANQAGDAMIAECARTGQSHSEYLGQRFTEADLVFSVWTDKREPDGVGAGILKGAGKIQMYAQHPVRDKKIKAALYVVRSTCKAEAAAMAQVFGDDRAESREGGTPAPGMPSTGGHLLSLGTAKSNA